MKRLLLIALLLSVGFSQQEYNFNDLREMDNGLWTEKFSDEPISGKVFGYFGYNSGEVQPLKYVYIGKLRNGKKEGEWVSYFHSNGEKKYEWNYKDGERDGLWTGWYENGQKEEEGTYKDGEWNGLWTWWYSNGQKKAEGTYKNGKKDGLWTGWYSNGQKKAKGTYKDGEKDRLWTKWYKNGQKKFEFTFKDGKRVDVIGMWNEDGSMME